MNTEGQFPCPACGQPMRPTATSCGYCGQEVPDADVTMMRPRASTSPAASPAIPITAIPVSAAPQRSAVQLHPVIPNEVLAVMAVLGVLGVYTIYQGLRPLPDVLDASSTVSARFVLAVVILLLLVAAFGAACLAIAYLLAKADRVGRGLAYAMALALGISALLEDNSEGGFSSDNSSTWQVIIVLGSIAAAALLGLPAASRQFFTGPGSRDHDRPVSVVVVQVLVTCIGSLVALSGVLYLLVGSYKHSYYAVGIGLLALAGGYAAGYQLLRRRDPRAPVLTSVVAGIAIVLQLAGGSDITGFLLGIGPQVMIVVLLWASRDAVTYFGRTPSWLNGLPAGQGDSSPQ